MSYTGNDLISWGFEPGPWFKNALAVLNRLDQDPKFTLEDAKKEAALWQPEPLMELRDSMFEDAYYNFLPQPENKCEQDNYDAVRSAMRQIMRIPTVDQAAVMPDACPAGTIPVGGVVATKDAIHPGYHSADVCCSMAMTVIPDRHDPKHVLDIIQVLTHFGPTKRAARPISPPQVFIDMLDKNPFTAGLERLAVEHYTTQGDGNHFYFVGHLESTGELAIVSHHGSRGFGAQIYKRGLAAAQRETRKIAKGIPKSHSWLDTNTALGKMYWDALVAAQVWTKGNHLDLHRSILRLLGERKVCDQFWNPHNFVFQRDGLWVHAKGATPSYAGYSDDDSGRTIIPMNMAEPILITEHTNNPDALGFAPHGAGRNMSRTQFLREHKPEIPSHIDARFWCGIPDPSELPEAYKNSGKVISVLKEKNLARVVDRVMPYGSIMAGDWEQDAPWRKK